MKTMEHEEFVAWLEAREACDKAIEWVVANGLDSRDAWQQCERGDWLLWFALRVGCDRAEIVRAARECVRTAPLTHVPPGEADADYVADTASADYADYAASEAACSAAAAYAGYADYAVAYADAAYTAAYNATLLRMADTVRGFVKY